MLINNNNNLLSMYYSTMFGGSAWRLPCSGFVFTAYATVYYYYCTMFDDVHCFCFVFAFCLESLHGGCYAYAAELKHPYFKGDIDVSPAIPHSICLFVGSTPCWRHSSHHLEQVVQSLIPHNYRQNWCSLPSKLHVVHTHTRAVNELFTYEVLLYSSL